MGTLPGTKLRVSPTPEPDQQIVAILINCPVCALKLFWLC